MSECTSAVVDKSLDNPGTWNHDNLSRDVEAMPKYCPKAAANSQIGHFLHTGSFFLPGNQVNDNTAK